MKLKIILVLLLLIPSIVFGYEIDYKKSSVNFVACCHAFVLDVNGVFKNFKSVVNLDDNNKIVFLQAEIDADSVETDSNKRDNHLRSKDFFETNKYQKIIFTSSSIVEKENEIKVQGQLNVKNISKAIELVGIVAIEEDNLIINLEGEINSKDFTVGTSKQKDSVQLKIKLVLKNIVI